ncbi:ras-related protein Rab-33B-like [Lampris incognitus]|uniref:ras-related protein Rab-33B-like n=1 Tax=Lampris incognitus TaxID=2546036 RepID=UPI0024B531A8|nr:ras-related protein Rab-33B-like [Lampris incognitus]
MESSFEFSNSLSSVSSVSVRCRTFKIIVIGDSGVGKTCLTHRLCGGEFPTRAEATIGVDFRERLVEIEGECIKLQLWDTAGQERFRKSMVQHYYRDIHSVLFVYDVTCPASFISLPAWIEECRQNSLGQDVPRYLVGNKSDLRDPCAVKADHQVSWEQAVRLAEAHGMMLFETSAKCPPDSGASRAEEGARRRGWRDVAMSYRQDKVEAIVMALATRLKRQRKPTPLLISKGSSGSFKVPAKKKPDKNFWGCSC